MIIFFALGFVHCVYADSPKMCADAHVVSIDPISVQPNQDFTVGIEIDNCGDKIPDNVIFQITRADPAILIKDSLIANLGKMSLANSKRFITYHMRTSSDLLPGEHNFQARLSYGNDGGLYEKDYNFSITANFNEPELVVSGTKTDPERIQPNQNIILTIKIQNEGLGSAKNVRIRLDGLEFEGVKEAYLGEVDAGQEIPARFVLRSNKKGGSDFNVDIYYADAGENNQLVKFPLSLQIFSNTNYLYYGIGLAVLIIILLIIYSIIKRNKEDEES